MKLFKKLSDCRVGRFIIFFLFLICCASLAGAQPSYTFSSFLNPDPLLLACPDVAQKKRDNEFTYSGQPKGNFYCNPLMLDGEAFDYNSFTLESKGELKLIKSVPTSGKIVEIPFYVRLRRNGVFVTHPCGEGVIFSRIEISIILKVAQNGDDLIIEPVNKEDWPAKRIVKLGDNC